MYQININTGALHNRNMFSTFADPNDICNFYLFDMYAIVDIAGQQFKVVKDQKVYVHRLDAAEGTDMEFAKVLLIDNEGNIQVGNPVVEGAKIAAKVLTHVRGDKVLVFKKKRRKGYQKLNGHRQNFTQIQIQDIILG
jgi:large subunit ribosomal protein L21